MTAASQLQDIDDKFCFCSICLEQLKEPKLLPCLHRYCKDCLRSIIEGSYDVIKCPECREEIQIPTNGVDGFKTDFYSKSLVEYVQIQWSLKNDEIRKCYSCSKHLRVAAYCFKCNNFLCEDCYHFHVTNNIVKDHQKHTLSLEDIEAKNVTLEKLASMRHAPRCQIHIEEISKLYCETCNNLPVCMTCTYGEHKGHNLHEVKALAKLKREELNKQLKAVREIKEDKKHIPPNQVKENLILDVSIEKEKVLKMHDEKDQKIMKKIQYIEGRRQQLKQEKQNAEKKICDSLRNEMEKKIEGIKKKYDETLKVKKAEIEDSFEARESSLKNELAKLLEKRDCFDQDKKELLKSIETQLNENVEIIEAMSEHFENIKKRFETLNVISSSILASDNDWSAVQCIPDMCTAATNLMKDLKKDFPELTTLNNVTVNYKQYSFGKPNVTKISDEVNKKITINDPYQYVCGMTCSGDGNILISGITSDGESSFIIVVDMNGRTLKEKKLNTRHYPYSRYCKILSQHKVASACQPNEIGLYDVRDASYVKKNISDVINSWKKDRALSCVATDSVNNHILLGGEDSRDVYVFDDQLNYLHILTLPEMINSLGDMTVSNGHLLVSDYERKKCYITTMDGLESELVGEYIKPDLGGNDCTPISICTDRNGFVYILWKMNTFSSGCFLAQYDQEDSQVLTMREVDGKAAVVTVIETSQGEKLLVATFYSQTMDVYDLITKE